MRLLDLGLAFMHYCLGFDCLAFGVDAIEEASLGLRAVELRRRGAERLRLRGWEAKSCSTGKMRSKARMGGEELETPVAEGPRAGIAVSQTS